MLDISPKCFDDMVFANQTSKQLIRNILDHVVPFPLNGRCGLIFYGSPGTGKTTYAQIFCDEFERTFDAESDASMWTDNIYCMDEKEFLKQLELCEKKLMVSSLSASKYRYMIFNEVHALSFDKQERLKQFMENEFFISILTTNFIGRLDKRLFSHCYSVNFNPAEYSDYLPRLKELINKNKLPSVSDERLLELVEDAEGDWRALGPMLITECNLLKRKAGVGKQSKLKLVS